ncbi:MAG: AEC family transporter [Candidatus Kariarchaeaceae archaeon]
MASEFQILLETMKRTGNIYLGVAIGILWVHTPLEKYRKHFVFLTINTLTPLIIMISLLRIETFQGADWIFPVIAALAVTALGLVIPPLLAKLRKQEKPEPAEICTASFSNALNFPFPVIYAMAKDSIGFAGIFLAIAIVLRNSVGLWVSGMKLTKKNIKDMILFPPIWGTAVGAIMRFTTDIGSNSAIRSTPVEIFYQFGIFATVMTVGFSLQKPNLEYKHPMMRVGITRFLVSSIASIIIVTTFSLPKLIAIPIIVQMSAPPAVYNAIYAEKFGLNTELTSQIIVSLTLVALFLLPFELLLLQILFN